MKLVCLLAWTLGFAMPSSVFAAPACPEDPLSEGQAVQIQGQLFSALEHEDRTAWNLLVAPDFSAAERGKLYDSTNFFNLIASAHRAGIKLSWSVTEERIQSDCKLAIMSYVNEGSVTNKGEDPAKVRWLETTAFRKEAEGWRVFLVTSMREADEVAR
jgi:hypothetical protein